MSTPPSKPAGDAFRVVGEDAPRWLAASLVLVGGLVAGAMAWLWTSRSPADTGTRAIVTAPRPVDAPAGAAPAPGAPAPVAAAATAAAPATGAVKATGEVAAGIVSSGAPAPIPATVPAGPAAAAAAPRPDCPRPIAVLFRFATAAPVDNDMVAALQPLIDWMNAHPAAKLSVQGHADTVGVDQPNVLLSYRRARVVSTRLASAGLPAQRMALSAAGSNEPIEGIPGDSQLNRRVVVSVRGGESCDRNDW